MNSGDFNTLAKLLKDRSGLVLTEDKQYLLESRLVPVAKKHGLPSLEDLVKKVTSPPQDEGMIKDVVDAMTTNESFFFRDIKPFDTLRDQVLPALVPNRSGRKLRIWCAACSSGQEPYSIAMMLREMGPKMEGWQVDILATDLSRDMVVRAREGVYSQFEVQRGLPITLLVKYFTQVGERWQISPDLRKSVDFREFNLLHDMSALGRFDIIFCRNVLIYFDQPTKAKVLQSMADVLVPDGYLFLGGAETVLGISDRFQPATDMRGVYEVSRAKGLKTAAG